MNHIHMNGLNINEIYIYIYQQTKAISRKSKMNNTKGNKNVFSYVDAF